MKANSPLQSGEAPDGSLSFDTRKERIYFCKGSADIQAAPRSLRDWAWPCSKRGKAAMAKYASPPSRFYYSVSCNTVLRCSTILLAANRTYLWRMRDTLSLTPRTQVRRSPMKKLIAIIALAMAVISSPVFAHATTFEDPTHGAGIASQS